MNDTISYDDEEAITNIAFGTTAEAAYETYLEKKKKIAQLEYECTVFVDKYHEEMRKARIPCQFRQDLIKDMFAKGDDKETKKKRDFARGFFLDKCFSDDFLQKHRIAFKELMWHGYERSGAVIALDIDGCDYYSVEIPFPNNIKKDETRKRLMGLVMFRADRIAKSNWDNFVKDWKAVQMPTYDWKACFDAIEKDVLALKDVQQTNCKGGKPNAKGEYC